MISLFQKKEQKIIESEQPDPIVIDLLKNCEEYEAAYRLNLPVQKEIQKMKKNGYQVIYNSEITKKLQVQDKWGFCEIESFTGEIPLGALLKYEEEKKKNIFSAFFIAAPEEYIQKGDPLLIGRLTVDAPKAWIQLNYLLAEWQ